MKIFLFLIIILLNGCLPFGALAPGFYAGSADVYIKSKEHLNETKCEWRCYEKKRK